MITDKPNAESAHWQAHETENVYETPFFTVRKDALTLPNGEKIDFTYVEKPGFVEVVPLTPEDNIILQHLYRYTTDQWHWEIVAGGINDKKGKSLEEVCREELAEEIGGTAKRIEYLGAYYTGNGNADDTGHYFIAYDTALTQEPQRESTETVKEVKEFSLQQAVDMVHNGTINDVESAFGILLAAHKVQVPKQEP